MDLCRLIFIPSEKARKEINRHNTIPARSRSRASCACSRWAAAWGSSCPWSADPCWCNDSNHLKTKYWVLTWVIYSIYMLPYAYLVAVASLTVTMTSISSLIQFRSRSPAPARPPAPAWFESQRDSRWFDSNKSFNLQGDPMQIGHNMKTFMTVS